MRLNYRIISLLVISFSITAAFTPILPSYLIDIDFWIRWSEYIFVHGITGIYQNMPDCNYPPIFLYILQIYTKSLHHLSSIKEYIYILKIGTLIFDYLPLFFALFYLPFLKINYRKSLLLIANLAYLYNSLLWGQIDAIHTAFIFISLSCFYNRSVSFGIFFYTISICVKAQSIIYCPLVLIGLWYNLSEDFFWKKFSKGIFFSMLTVFMLFIPFILNTGISSVVAPYTKAIGFYKTLSFNAFNFWYFFTSNAHQIEDTHRMFYLTFHSWGLILFGVTYVLSITPLIQFLILKKIDKTEKVPSFELIMLSVVCVTLCFFYFNTQMHERYSHPILLFGFFYGLASKRWKIYILASIAYLANMEGVCKSITGGASYHLGQPMTYLKNLEFGLQYSNELLGSVFYLILILISFWELYHYYYNHKNTLQILQNYFPISAKKPV